jgi:peptide/nickel transport system permease protein
MLRLIAGRCLFSVMALLLISFVLFVLTRSLAGSPALTVLGNDATPEQVADFMQVNGLDRPVLAQYGDWLLGIVLHGDFGRSFVTGRSMSVEVARGLPITFEIVLVAFIFALAVSIPLGILSATFQDSAADHIVRILAVGGVSVPSFWLGLLLIRLFAVELGWLPPGSFAPLAAGLVPHIKSILLPAFTLGIYYVAIFTRMTRASLIDVLAQDHVRTARAMGLSRGRVLVYALKNAMVPVVSIAAMSFGYMFGGALIVEHVFSIPGMSRSLLNAIGLRDYYMVQAVVFVITLIFIAANLIADLINRQLSPKLATGGS